MTDNLSPTLDNLFDSNDSVVGTSAASEVRPSTRSSASSLAVLPQRPSTAIKSRSGASCIAVVPARPSTAIKSSGDPLVDRVMREHMSSNRDGVPNPKFLGHVQRRLLTIRHDAATNRDRKSSYLVKPAPKPAAPSPERDGPFSRRRMSQAARLSIMTNRMKHHYHFGLPATVCLFVKLLTHRVQLARAEKMRRLDARRRSVAKANELKRLAEQSLSGRIAAACGKEQMLSKKMAAAGRGPAAGGLGITGARVAMQGGMAFATRTKRLGPAHALELRLQELEQDLCLDLSGDEPPGTGRGS